MKAETVFWHDRLVAAREQLIVAKNVLAVSEHRYNLICEHRPDSKMIRIYQDYKAMQPREDALGK